MFELGVNFAGGLYQGDREEQEDNYGFVNSDILEQENSLLLLLADGMGGHTSGELASLIAVETFAESFVENSALSDHPRLLHSLHAANAGIDDAIKENPHHDGMGCTFVGVLFRENTMRWISVGDSPLWIFQKGKLRQLNQVHTVAVDLDAQVASSQISDEVAICSPHRNKLTSALTGNSLELIDCPVEILELVSEDVIVCGSDGILSLEENKLIRCLEACRVRSAREVVDRMIYEIEELRKEKQDNAAVAVIKIS